MNIICWQFFVGLALGITLTHLVVILFRGRDNVILRPRDIADSTAMNAFGCVLLYMLFAILSPIVFIFKLFYMLAHISGGNGRRRNSYETKSTFDPQDIRRYND